MLLFDNQLTIINHSPLLKLNLYKPQFSDLNTISFVLYPLSFILSLKQKPDPDPAGKYE